MKILFVFCAVALFYQPSMAQSYGNQGSLNPIPNNIYQPQRNHSGAVVPYDPVLDRKPYDNLNNVGNRSGGNWRQGTPSDVLRRSSERSNYRNNFSGQGQRY